MNNKILTVVTCAHQHGQFLKRCYHSLLDQTLDKSEWQWYVLLDGCSDNSLELIQKYKQIEDNRSDGLLIKVFQKEKKTRLAQAKNFILREVDSELVAMQDADDISMANRLEMQLHVMRDGIQEPNGLGFYRPDVCGTQAWDLYEDGRLLVNCFSIGQYQYHNQIIERLLFENVMCHTSIMIRKDILDKLCGYDESEQLIGREDHDLWLRAAKSGYLFYNIPERLIQYSMGTSVER